MSSVLLFFEVDVEPRHNLILALNRALFRLQCDLNLNVRVYLALDTLLGDNVFKAEITDELRHHVQFDLCFGFGLRGSGTVVGFGHQSLLAMRINVGASLTGARAGLNAVSNPMEVQMVNSKAVCHQMVSHR